MIISFKVGNYLSFRDVTTFSLKAQTIKEKSESHTFPIAVGEISLLKSVALYGPNGSGKSNLLKAIQFVVTLIQSSAKDSQAEEEIPVTHFKLSTKTEDQPSYFQLEILVHDIVYRYGFTAIRKQIETEWLYFTKKQKEYPLYNRDHDHYIIDQKFSEGKDIQKKTRPNALFLSAVAQWNGEIAISILETLSKLKFFNDVLDFRDFRHTTKLIEESDYRNAVLDFLKSADLGIKDVKIESLELNAEMLKIFSEQTIKLIKGGGQSKAVKTSHSKFDGDGREVSDVYLDLLTEESLGTQKIFSLAGPIIDALRNGKVLIIDEFTSRLHPLITRFIIKKFNSIDYNTSNAQLIFASHNYGLMERDLFRSDQVFFTRKNKQNATELTSFFEQKIRSDASFRGKYFGGEGFGAKPNIPNENKSEQLGLFESE